MAVDGTFDKRLETRENSLALKLSLVHARVKSGGRGVSSPTDGL